MSVDVVVGELAFVDLTFVGLDAVPVPGEERWATDLLRSPGGGAIVAIGAQRLGLQAAVASPIGADPEGDYLRSALAAEGVRWVGRKAARTAVTAVMPAGGERAMATVGPGEEVTAGELAAVDPRAVVLSLPRLELAPPDARLYATAGDEEARPGLLPPRLGRARALLVNAREGRLLTGEADPEAAARALGAHVRCAVVTRGAGGAVACAGGELVRAPGIAVDAVDTTGAGDLFTAAYVWADLQGLPVADRLALGRAPRRAVGPGAHRGGRSGHARRALARSTTPRPRASRRRGVDVHDEEEAMKVRTPGVAVVLAVAAFGAGCGTPGGSGGDAASKNQQEAAKTVSKPDPSKAGDVTLTVWDQEVRGGQAAQIKQLNDAFQQKYPNVKIKRVAKSFDDLNKTLKLAVSSSKAPDVVEANQGRPIMGTLVKGGLLRPLDPYAKAFDWDQRYSKLLLDLNKFSPDGKTFGAGNLYGLSQMGEIVGVFYNKDKVSDPPKTMADFEASLADAKKQGDIPIQFGNLDKWPGIHEYETRLRRHRRRQDGDPRLHVRALGRVASRSRSSRPPRPSCRSGSRRATSRRTSTARATTRPGSASPRARAAT